jgi:hypothetical protein
VNIQIDAEHATYSGETWRTTHRVPRHDVFAVIRGSKVHPIRNNAMHASARRRRRGGHDDRGA